MKVTIDARWDVEARCWSAATRDDNPWHTAIATEGNDLEHLRARLADLIEDIRTNHDKEDVTFELVVHEVMDARSTEAA